MAVKINFPQPDTLYTAGLLMYIGRLILALLPADFNRDAVQHHKLAASQLALWHFPPILIEAIGQRETATTLLTEISQIGARGRYLTILRLSKCVCKLLINKY